MAAQKTYCAKTTLRTDATIPTTFILVAIITLILKIRLQGALNFNYYGFKQQGEFEGRQYGANNKTWTSQLNSKIKLPKNLAIETIFSYRAKFQDIQSVNKAVYRLNIGLSKDILNEKMTLNLAANNLLNTLIDRRELNTPSYQLQSTNYGLGRVFNATVVYRFNRKKGDKDRLPDEN